MKSTENKELIAAMEELELERGINKQYLLESLETALVTAYKRNFDSAENVVVEINKRTGNIKVYALKEVVNDVVNKMLQIDLKDAKKIDKKVKIGERVKIEIVPRDFGRIAAQTAKQVIVQKIREAERDIVFNEYNNRKGEIVSGIIQKADGGVVVLDLGRLEGIMLLKDQIPTEQYRVNDKIRAYVLNVEKGLKGAPQVLVSRSHPDFVRKLFEFEIPEIYEGLIEIKSVARDAGSRSKVAVYSTNENIDPVGSCVGQKGIRIQNIISELKGEKIDVIEWNEEPSIFISSALLPAQVMAVDIKQEEKFAQVIVPDDQLSLAIGKTGQNVRLAARLTGWKIDIKSEAQFRELLEKQENEGTGAEATTVGQEETAETEEATKVIETEQTIETEKGNETEEAAKTEKTTGTEEALEVNETTETEETTGTEEALEVNKTTETKKPAKAKKTTKTKNSVKVAKTTKKEKMSTDVKGND